jgi:hypothetical protein
MVESAQNKAPLRTITPLRSAVKQARKERRRERREEGIWFVQPLRAVMRLLLALSAEC